MIKKHDFKKALSKVKEDLDGEEIFTFRDCGYDIEVLSKDTWKTIQYALRLADRLQSGNVSDLAMGKLFILPSCSLNQERVDNFYTQLMKEVENE